LLSFPLGNGTPAVIAIIGALALICMGTGLFKGNLQVMVGDLYKSPELAGKRDAAFSIFYMAINIGALFAPSAAVKIMEYAQNIGFSKADSYHFAFAVACVSLIISMLIYFASRSTFRHVEGKQEKADSTEENKAKEETFAGRHAGSHRCALPRFRRGHLLLDGVPPKRAYLDLFRC